MYLTMVYFNVLILSTLLVSFEYISASDITRAPKLSSVITNHIQKENSSFLIFCRVQEGSLPLFFEWSKNGHPIHNNRYEIENSKKFSTLNIERINREDAGNYSCKVKNAYGSDLQNVQLNVKGKS